jgi:hypothetical protein
MFDSVGNKYKPVAEENYSNSEHFHDNLMPIYQLY